MTLKEFIESLQKEIKENPDWENKELVFATEYNSEEKFFLSIYTSDDKKKLYIDIGTGNE